MIAINSPLRTENDTKAQFCFTCAIGFAQVCTSRIFIFKTSTGTSWPTSKWHLSYSSVRLKIQCNVVPAPKLLVTEMVPPWASTIDLVSGNPNHEHPMKRLQTVWKCYTDLPGVSSTIGTSICVIKGLAHGLYAAVLSAPRRFIILLMASDTHRARTIKQHDIFFTESNCFMLPFRP